MNYFVFFFLIIGRCLGGLRNLIIIYFLNKKDIIDAYFLIYKISQMLRNISLEGCFHYGILEHTHHLALHEKTKNYSQIFFTTAGIFIIACGVFSLFIPRIYNNLIINNLFTSFQLNILAFMLFFLNCLMIFTGIINVFAENIKQGNNKYASYSSILGNSIYLMFTLFFLKFTNLIYFHKFLILILASIINMSCQFIFLLNLLNNNGIHLHYKYGLASFLIVKDILIGFLNQIFLHSYEIILILFTMKNISTQGWVLHLELTDKFLSTITGLLNSEFNYNIQNIKTKTINSIIIKYLSIAVFITIITYFFVITGNYYGFIINDFAIMFQKMLPIIPFLLLNKMIGGILAINKSTSLITYSSIIIFISTFIVQFLFPTINGVILSIFIGYILRGTFLLMYK